MDFAITKTELLNFLKKYGLSPNKKLGQNFLVDENVVRKIILFSQAEGKEVIEIGAGPGTLTVYLAEIARKVVAVEIDKKILNVLKEVCQDIPNIQIVNNDFLKLNVKDLTNTGRVYIVGNLPYYITSQILFKLFEEREYIEKFTIMVQKEVAQRLLAKPGTKEYGNLTVAMKFYCEIEDYFYVSKNVFYPKPEVDSAVLRARFKDSLPEIEHRDFFKIVHACFSTRRKTILNALSNHFDIGKDKLKRIINMAEVDENLRAEDLSLDDYIRLYKCFEEEFLKS
ncbi:dimethyladenosine transferase [Caldicellulosiruptor owensensis OL]|uniref:Ribosomal RNA small subunit methyltransferase A n=1 Tax=Caldicellulosiruptor owensensis (strain ATCC 700167 / DSM 13100 / OL) TaxID=632518 RepID=E4Q315_CALOW|nr:16S rRNA (adenine(1518)-N(6)/adenine(1519)-N(6))-dimethyltransferase RsmA [Caldicellulosiruptor owensensis]ADQ03851.1 dimethyladenosine transferase [Caldicellulosiruptor owensensis OL]